MFFTFIKCRLYDEEVCVAMADKADRMREDMYYIAGKVNVPEEKREEFNRYVLELLYKCGIRRLVKRKVNGRSFNLVEPPKPDKNGIVKFNYSIFEQKERKINTYNMNTCELVTPDRGYNEFGVVMNLIMVLQECYSDGSCYFMSEDRPSHYADSYLMMLNSLFDKIFDLPHRRRMWEVEYFFRTSYSKEVADKALEKIIEMLPYVGGELKCDFKELSTVMFLGRDSITISEEANNLVREDIAKAGHSIRYEYLYKIVKGLTEKDEAKLRVYLRQLAVMDKFKRQELAKQDDDYGIIAELSQHLLPPVIVHTYALAKGEEFWDIWNSLNIDSSGYRDIIRYEEEDEGEPKNYKLPLYKVYQRSNEDEFLEFWDGDNLILSEDMENAIQVWKDTFHKLQVPANYDTEKELANILTELDELWNRRYVDLEFVKEVTKHKEDDNYKKALMVLKSTMDEYATWFPELTRTQANRWVAKGGMDVIGYVKMQAFTSLMINNKQRKNIFGF